MSFWHRFLGFRKDFAALTYDAFRAVREGTFAVLGRLLALVALALLLTVPATVLLLGEDAFGNKWAFGGALGLWPVILEAPGWWLRREDAARLSGLPPPSGTPGFDAPMFILLTLVSVAVEVAVFYLVLGDRVLPGSVWRGILWGIALAGALDFARTVVASFLAGAEGYPLYR